MPKFFEIAAEAMLCTVYDRIGHGDDVFIEAILSGDGLCIFKKSSAAAIELFISHNYILLLFIIKAGPVQAAFIDAANQRRIMPLIMTNGGISWVIPESPAAYTHLPTVTN